MKKCGLNTFDVSTAESRGNVAISKAVYKPGQVIVESIPFSWLVQSKRWSNICSTCMAKSGSSVRLYRCNKCKLLHYCSQVCQKVDWVKHHKKECDWLSNLASLHQSLQSDQLDTIVLIRRVLSIVADGKRLDQNNKLTNTEQECQQNTPAQNWPIICCSSAHFQRLATGGGAITDQDIATIQLACKLTQQPMKTVVDIFTRFRCNNFGILDSLLDCVGEGVYPIVAALNHSCQPNCCLSYRFSSHGPSVQVRLSSFLIHPSISH